MKISQRASVVRLGWLAVALAFAAGCQAPIVEPSNVVEDENLPDCSPETLARVGPLDVAIAIDTSLSTLGPSGSDIDGDGEVGAFEDNTVSDRDDTVLSAQVAAIRPLLDVTDLADVRFSIVTFSGPATRAPAQKRSRVVKLDQARIRVHLTEDKAALAEALEKVLTEGPRGTTHFYAGMRHANRTLIEGEDPERESRRLVLFISDSPGPTHRDIDGRMDNMDPYMQLAARQALRNEIVFNTFGLSSDSGRWRFFPIGRIAGATGGSYHVVEDPRALYCHLASSLVVTEPPL